MLRAASFALLATLTVGCGARSDLLGSTDASGGGAPTTSGDGDGGGATSSSSTSATSTSSTGGEDPLPPECEDDQRFVFIVSYDELFAFDPATMSVTSRGAIGCDVSTMGIDRHGLAYTPGGDGLVRRFDVRDPVCEDVGYLSTAEFGFWSFMVAFALDETFGETETMYLMDRSLDDAMPSTGLATVDPSTLELRYVGPFENEILAIEPATSNDGRLFGFAVDLDGLRDIVEIDKATAQFLWSVPLGDVGDFSYFAQAFWEGSLYVFTGDELGTRVTIVDVATQAQRYAGYLPGLSVIAAGVTTCP
jgi:hypothetical protein